WIYKVFVGGTTRAAKVLCHDETPEQGTPSPFGGSAATPQIDTRTLFKGLQQGDDRHRYPKYNDFCQRLFASHPEYSTQQFLCHMGRMVFELRRTIHSYHRRRKHRRADQKTDAYWIGQHLWVHR